MRIVLPYYTGVDEYFISTGFWRRDYQKFHCTVALIAHLVRFARFNLQPISSIQQDGAVNKAHGGLSGENIEKLLGLLMIVHILGGAGWYFLSNNAQIIPLYQVPAFAPIINTFCLSFIMLHPS